MNILDITGCRVSIFAGTIIIICAFVFGFHVFKTSPELPSPSLKTLAAQHGIELGNFAISSYLDEPHYTNILASQFNLALIDNTPNWYFTDGGLRPTPTTFSFATMDKVVAFAQTHRMHTQAHHLLWEKANGCHPGSQTVITHQTSLWI